MLTMNDVKVMREKADRIEKAINRKEIIAEDFLSTYNIPKTSIVIWMHNLAFECWRRRALAHGYDPRKE